MRKIIFIVEECHGTIGADSSIPIKEAFGENWQEEFMKLEEDDFDGQFYFYEKDFLE